MNWTKLLVQKEQNLARVEVIDCLRWLYGESTENRIEVVGIIQIVRTIEKIVAQTETSIHVFFIIRR